MQSAGASSGSPSSNNPSIAGAAVTFTASVTSPVTGTPTGTVTFQDGASALGTGTLSGGTATFTTSGLTAGTHSITAIYGGGADLARRSGEGRVGEEGRTPGVPDHLKKKKESSGGHGQYYTEKD